MLGMFAPPPRRRSPVIPPAFQTTDLEEKSALHSGTNRSMRLITAATTSSRRGVVCSTLAAITLFIVYFGSWRSHFSVVCTAHNPCRVDAQGNLVSIADGKTSRAGFPPDAANRPYYDLVVAVLVVGGESQDALDEISRVRRVYARYGSRVLPDGRKAAALTFKLVFVVGNAGAVGGDVPDCGLLLGDLFHVNIREGYTHLSDKTKAMMALSEHLRFRFLAKTDGDTFPCLGRVTQQLIEMPVDDQPRVYAGLLATCGKVFPEGHKLHDPEFLKATGGVLPCHPMYHQGAFYVLGVKMVEHLHRSRDVLTVMSVEDAMVGLWLLGVNKVILDIGGHFYCKCFTHPVPREKLSFYHFCKTDEKITGCLKKFGTC